MKELLEKILNQLEEQTKELAFQTKLMKDLFHRKDETQFNAASMNQNLSGLISQISQMPGMKQPEAQNVLKNITKIIPGGGKNG